ncbi:MAG: polysaccharide deacetylase family protein [Terriglobales bacterium]
MILHDVGAVAALRSLHRGKFRVLMFHSFEESDTTGLEMICSHITRCFVPISMTAIGVALKEGNRLPDYALAVTVDDGYRSFLANGWPIFQRYRIPVTIYAVAAFSDGRSWLWWDQIEFALEHTIKTSLTVGIGGAPAVDLDLSSNLKKAQAMSSLTEELKNVPNDVRIEFLNGLGRLCGLEIPQHPPPHREAMSWEELRALASDGVEVGCHTETHPILSRLTDLAQLEQEIRGAKKYLEDRLGFPVTHFSYPNGREIDITDSVVACVRDADFATAVTTTCGLNTMDIDPLRIQRVPFGSQIDLRYGIELLAGLHL